MTLCHYVKKYYACGAKTKKDAVVHALKEFNRKHRLAKLADMLGTFKDFMAREDLSIMREKHSLPQK